MLVDTRIVVTDRGRGEVSLYFTDGQPHTEIKMYGKSHSWHGKTALKAWKHPAVYAEYPHEVSHA